MSKQSRRIRRQFDTELSAKGRDLLSQLIRAHNDPAFSTTEFEKLIRRVDPEIKQLSQHEQAHIVMALSEVALEALLGRPIRVTGMGME